MPVYMIRWPNGDIALAAAGSEEEARLRFDEIGEPMNLPVLRLDAEEFLLSLRLGDDFTFEVEAWGEEFLDALEWAYPLATQAQLEEPDGEPGEAADPGAPAAALREAVRRERERVVQERAPGQKAFIHEYWERRGIPPADRAEMEAQAREWGMSLEEYLFARKSQVAAEVEGIPVRGGDKRGSVVRFRPGEGDGGGDREPEGDGAPGEDGS
jgi:hypothetical protein